MQLLPTCTLNTFQITELCFYGTQVVSEQLCPGIFGISCTCSLLCLAGWSWDGPQTYCFPSQLPVMCTLASLLHDRTEREAETKGLSCCYFLLNDVTFTAFNQSSISLLTGTSNQKTFDWTSEKCVAQWKFPSVVFPAALFPGHSLAFQGQTYLY